MLRRAGGLQRGFCLGRVAEGLVSLFRAFFGLCFIFSVNNNASMTHRTAAERHRICQTQHGWEGKARLLYKLSFISHPCSYPTRSGAARGLRSLLAAGDQGSLSKEREAVGFAAYTGLNLTSYSIRCSQLMGLDPLG